MGSSYCPDKLLLGASPHRLCQACLTFLVTVLHTRLSAVYMLVVFIVFLLPWLGRFPLLPIPQGSQMHPLWLYMQHLFPQSSSSWEMAPPVAQVKNMGAVLNSSFSLISQMYWASKHSRFSFLPILTTAPCFSRPLPLLRSALTHLCLALPSRLGLNPLPLHKSHSSQCAIPSAPTTSCLLLAPPFHCLDPSLVLHSPELNPNFSPWQRGPHDLMFLLPFQHQIASFPQQSSFLLAIPINLQSFKNLCEFYLQFLKTMGKYTNIEEVLNISPPSI